MLDNISVIAGISFAAFIGFVLFMRIWRRRARRLEQAPTPPSFDSAELQALRESGRLSPEEFERVRSAIERRRDETPSSPPSGPRGFDVLPTSRDP